MVADLKVGSLTFKYVFHRPEHNAKGGIPWITSDYSKTSVTV